MAKVSPLLGVKKHNWKLRLVCLIKALGQNAFDQAEEGSNVVGHYVQRRGTKLSVSSRLYKKQVETIVRLYTKLGFYTYMTRADKDDLINVDKKDEVMFDFRDNYKRLERMVYSHMSPERSSEIMSKADSKYTWSLDHE